MAYASLAMNGPNPTRRDAPKAMNVYADMSHVDEDAAKAARRSAFGGYIYTMGVDGTATQTRHERGSKDEFIYFRLIAEGHGQKLFFTTPEKYVDWFRRREFNAWKRRTGGRGRFRPPPLAIRPDFAVAWAERNGHSVEQWLMWGEKMAGRVGPTQQRPAAANMDTPTNTAATGDSTNG